MPLSEILNRNITYSAPSVPVRQIAEIMLEDDVGAVVIVDDTVPNGIVTDRDIVLRAVAKGLDAETTPIEAIMSRGVETVSTDDGIYAVANKMRAAHVRRVVVTDRMGTVVGLLSFDDVFDLLTAEMDHLRDAVLPTKPKLVERR